MDNNNQSDSASKWKKIDEEAMIDEQQDVEMNEDDSQDGLTYEELLQKNLELTEANQAIQDKQLVVQAEMQNVRRRAEKDVEQAHRYANKNILQDLLPVLDSLVRAQEGVDVSDPQVKSVIEGIQLTADMFEKVLAKNGVVVINPEVGDAFDPEKHEAMSMMSDPDAESNTILQVFQRGYELNGRVIRAAMVAVAQ